MKRAAAEVKQSPEAGKKLKSRSLVWNPPALDSPVAGVASSPPCDLPAVLARAGERTSAMVHNLQNLTAQEDIDYRNQDRQTYALNFGSEVYDYVVVFQQHGDQPIVDERRHANHGTPSYIAAESRGLPEMARLFLPSLQPDYDMKCDGQVSWEGQPAWLWNLGARLFEPLQRCMASKNEACGSKLLVGLFRG